MKRKWILISLALVLAAMVIGSVVLLVKRDTGNADPKGTLADTGIPKSDPAETNAPETDPSETDSPETAPPETDAPETDPPETNFPEAVYIESAFAKWSQLVTASVGEVRFPVFIIDFQDVKYNESLVPKETLEEWIFTGFGSVADYYHTSSHGRLHMSGDIYYYTAKGNIKDYETHEALENLIVEAFSYYDDEVDFTIYDQNKDDVMDSLIFSVPAGGDASFWWAATHKWYCLPDYSVDGLYIVNYIVNDIQPYQSSKYYLIETLEHETGHCLGLPDYYKYEYSGSDFEGMHGMAGTEMMDDSKGDFSQFSKLQLGWLTEEQVQIMPSDVDRASFLLPPACEGGCILIFPRGQEADFQSEYFVVEYNTPAGLMRGIVTRSGVRVMHAQAELLERSDGYFEYKYGNYSEYYDHSNNGIRVLKLVKDGMGFFHEGDVVSYEDTGAEKGNFGWYTEDGQITDPGFSIQIGELTDTGVTIEIIWDE